MNDSDNPARTNRVASELDSASDEVDNGNSRSRRRPAWVYLLTGGAAFSVLLACAALVVIVIKLQNRNGTVELDINEPGADVFIDDQHHVTIGDAHLNENAQIHVKEGKHTLKVTKSGYITHTGEIEVKKGERMVVRVTLLPDRREIPEGAGPVTAGAGIGGKNPRKAKDGAVAPKLPPVDKSAPSKKSNEK
jgi:hypothetical protein